MGAGLDFRTVAEALLPLVNLVLHALHSISFMLNSSLCSADGTVHVNSHSVSPSCCKQVLFF